MEARVLLVRPLDLSRLLDLWTVSRSMHRCEVKRLSAKELRISILASNDLHPVEAAALGEANGSVVSNL